MLGLATPCTPGYDEESTLGKIYKKQTEQNDPQRHIWDHIYRMQNEYQAAIAVLAEEIDALKKKKK